jgi:hypothetical protein
MAALPRNLPRLASLADFDRSNLLGPQLVLVGSGSVVIAAFGPWVTVADAVTRHTINGTNGGRHGTGCIVMALVGAALVLPTVLGRRLQLLALPAVGLGLVIMTYGFADSGSIRHHEQVYTEWGLWLTILGGASLAVGAVLTLLRR